MLLATDINDCIFSYLFAEELCNCFATCRLWNASKDSKSTSVLIWFNLYRNLVGFPKLTPHPHNFSWHKKVKELYSFVTGTNPFTLTDGRLESQKSNKVPRVTLNSIQPIRLVCRSGHTASLFYVDNREVIVFFGGATHFYTFVNSYDILSVDDGVPLRTYATVNGDIPTARWLHRACSYESHTKVIVFGGQINDGAFSNEVFQFTLVESDTGGCNSSLSLESVLVPPIDGDNNNGPQPRGGHSFVYDKTNNRFIVFGGLTSGNEVEVCVNDTYQLVIENDTLFTLNEAVSPGRLGYDCRKKGTSSSDSGDDRNIGTSGSSSSSGPMAVWRKLHCTGSLPSPRWCHSGVLQGEDMIVFGGWSYERTVGVGTGSKFFNDVHILNITTLVWTNITTTGSPPRARCQCACFLFENKIDDPSDEKGSEEEKNNMIERIKIKNHHHPEDTSARWSKGNNKIELSPTSISMHSNEGKSTSSSSPSSSSTLTLTPLSLESIPSMGPRSKSKPSSPLEPILSSAEELKRKTLKISKLSRSVNNNTENYCKDENIDMHQLSILDSNIPHELNHDSRKDELTASGKLLTEKRNNCKETSLRETLDQILESATDTNEGFKDGEVYYRVEGEKIFHGEEQDSALKCSVSGGSGASCYPNSSSNSSCSINVECSGNGSNNSNNNSNNSSNNSSNYGSNQNKKSNDIHVKNTNTITNSSNIDAEIDAEIEIEIEIDIDIEQSTPSKGYMIIFGGSCHNQEVESANVAYGSLVVDFHDFKVLDLDTLVWLPVSCSYPRCRGGIHAIVETKRGWLLSGGMQTEGISDMPRFKNDTTFIIPNVGCEVYDSPTWRSSRKMQHEPDEDLRVKNKFLFVKA